jgi:hypothetical protein
MAYVNPALIASLITDHHDGTFGVAMFDPAGKAITVAVDSTILVESGNASNLGEVSSSKGKADWATILEKAVMKYDVAYNMVGPIDGIGSETMIPMFTGDGDSIAISPGVLSAADMQQIVDVSLASGHFITGGFNQELPLGANQTVTAHGYAVMVPTAPASDIVDMRNPWGVNPWASGSSKSGYDTSTDGLLHIPKSTSPTDWTTIIDLRIIDSGPHCSGVAAPFTPQRLVGAPIHIREPHSLPRH